MAQRGSPDGARSSRRNERANSAPQGSRSARDGGRSAGPGIGGGGNNGSKSQRSGGQADPKLNVHTAHKNTHAVDMNALFIDSFRKAIVQRGGSSGIHGLGRIFKGMDDNGNRTLSIDELQTGLHDYGLALDKQSCTLLMHAVDKDNRGAISFDRFLSTIRGPVNKRRRAMIDTVFKAIDRNGNGFINADDIQNHFNAGSHPDVESGKLDKKLAVSNFLAQFDGPQKDGTITEPEFQDYYKNVSSSIDNDDYFELMMRNAWHVRGGSGQFTSSGNTRVLVTFVDGSQKVVAIEDDLGVDFKNHKEVLAHLKQQGLKNVVSASRSGAV